MDVAGGLVGVPLRVSGPLGATHVSVSMAQAAPQAAGAAVGTAVLPGIGTVIGAEVGKVLGSAMGGPPEKKDGKRAR